MKRIFASTIWTRVILVLALIFIVWSITLIVSVKRQQADLAHEVGLINKLNGVAQSIMTLEKSLSATGPDSLARWRSLYQDYRARRAEFDPGDPAFRDLQVNLIRTDSLLIRLDRLHADFRQAVADPVLQKSLEADFHREINAATVEVQNAVQTIRRRTGQISVLMAENWNALFVLVLVACGLAIAVTLLLRLLQKEMAKIKAADESLRQSEERIRQTFEHAPIGMTTSTAEGKFIQVNPAFCKLLGYSEAELLRRNLAEISHPEDLAAHRELLSRLLRGEISQFQLEKRYLTAKRQIVYALLQASLGRDVEGTTPLVIEQVVDMTERKKAEFARRQSEERFRELAENIAEVFWLTDPAKNEMLYVSPTYEKIWDRSCQSLYETPQQWFDAVHPDDRERVKKAALTKQVIGQYDETYRILRPDGESRWIRDRAFPIGDEQGSVYRLAGIAEDITERKNIEATIRENEQRWNFALEGSGAGVWDWDAQTNKVFYSRRWKELLGYPEHEIGDSLDECYSRVHPDDLKAMVEALEKHLRGETPLYISEHRERCKDGSYKWILDRGKVIARTAEGKPLRVVGTHTDITEQTQAKAELKQAEEETRKSEEQFRLTFEMAPIGMTITDVDGSFRQCNRAFCEMLGYAAEELQSKTWVDVTHPNDVSTNIAFRERLLRDEIPNFQMQKRYLAKDGRAVPALLQMMLMKDEHGRPLHFISQTVNLSALQQTQEELTKQSAILQSLVDSMADGVVVADMNGKLLLFNPAAGRIAGIRALDSDPDDWAEKYGLYLPDTITPFPKEKNPMVHAMRGETAPAVEIFMRHSKRPEGVWLSVTGTPLKDHTGALAGGVVVFRDVTVQKQAEESLRKNEEQFRLTFEHAPIGMAISSIDGAILQVNQAYCDLLGRTAEELVNRSVVEFTYPDDTAENLDLTRKLLRGEIPHYQMEKRYLARDGHAIYAILQASLVRDRDGHPLHFIGQIADITKRKLAEEEVRKLNAELEQRVIARTKELQQSEERFRALYDDNPSIYLMVDANGVMLSVNQFGAEELGYPVAELVGEPIAKIFAAEDSGKARQHVNTCLKSPDRSFTWELRMLRKNDSKLWVREYARAAHDNAGHPVVLIVCEDITSRRQAELMLQANETRLRKQNESLGDLVRGKTFQSGNLQEALQAVTEVAASCMEVERVSVWFHEAARAKSICRDLFEWSRRQHSAGVELAQKDFLPYFEALSEGRDIDAHDAQNDYRTRCFRDSYLRPLGITSKLDAPIRVRGEMIGVLCHEHVGTQRQWTLDEQVFAGSLADLVAQALEAHERQRAEQALRESEERYRTLVEQMPDGIYRSTPDGRFVEVNPAMYQMFGYASKEEFLALDIPTQLYFSSDERNGAIQRLKQIGNEGITITRHRHKDGHEMWMEDHGRFIYDDRGNILYNEGILRDITARKKAEEALLANEERLRRQSESLRDLVSSKAFQSGDLPEVYQEITATVARCMNVARVSIWFYDDARSKIVCQNLYELNGDRHSQGVELLRKDFLPYFEALAESRYIDAHEAQTDYRTRCFTESYLKPLGITSMLDAPIRVGGEVIGVVCHEHVGPAWRWTLDEEVYASSIADLAALAIESRELQKSETRFRTLVETMNDGLVQLDEKGLLVYVNDKLCEMTGFSREQLLGREVLPRLDTESQDIFHEQIERRQIGESKPYEMEIRKKGSGKLPVLISPRPIFGFDSRFSGSFAVVTDISERKRMEEQIRQHAEELEQLVEERAKRIRLLEQQRAESEKLAATGRMSARIAHEINNPLAGIKNSFLLVKDGIPTTYRYYDYVRRIETEIERIARIVRQMFDLYRPQQDSVRSFPADIAIRDVVALLRTNCRERDITIDVDINAPVLNVALAEGSLRQVLYNIIQNAVDASAPGSTVRVRAVAEQQKLVINVIDQGQGIPEDIRTKIFEPFFTTKSGLERSGLGLGLSVSKGLVEAMGGKLDFESTVGQGTTFAIVLPLDGMSNKTAQH